MNESRPELAVVTDADLMRLDTDRSQLERHADGYRERAESEMREAARLVLAREFLAPRVGMPWEEVRADAEAELKIAKLKIAELQAHADQLREWHRDLVGAERVLEQEVARLKNEQGNEQASA